VRAFTSVASLTAVIAVMHSYPDDEPDGERD
jgi:hypothetical protein